MPRPALGAMPREPRRGPLADRSSRSAVCPGTAGAATGVPAGGAADSGYAQDVFVYNIESTMPSAATMASIASGTMRSCRRRTCVSRSYRIRGWHRRGQASAMTSYHALNGIPTTAHPILEQELRQRLGWANGLLMSDGGAVTDMLNFDYLNLSMTDNVTAAAAAALMAGVDLNSGGFSTPTIRPPLVHATSILRPQHDRIRVEHLPAALEQGLVTVAALRRSARRAAPAV